MALVDDQDPIQDLSSDAAHEALGDGVRSGSPHRSLDHLDAGRGEHRIEHGGEFGITISDEEPERPARVVQVHHQVTGQLCQPDPGGVRSDPEDMDLASGVLDDEERVQPAQRDGIDVKQVASQDRVGLSAQELRPSGPRSPWRRVDSRGFEDLPDSRGANPVAQAGKFAVDSTVPPGGILHRQTHSKAA